MAINLQKSSDFDKNTSGLYSGTKEIMSFLRRVFLRQDDQGTKKELKPTKKFCMKNILDLSFFYNSWVLSNFPEFLRSRGSLLLCPRQNRSVLTLFCKNACF